jgi:glycine betaine/proline transport system substrate-binding protein
MKQFFKRLSYSLLAFIFMMGINSWADAQEDDADLEAENQNLVTLTYVEWASEIASTYVVKVILEELGYEVEINAVTAALMWQAVANGEADGHVAAWLPTAHEHYLRAVKDKVKNLGPNLTGTKIGLVVPQTVPLNSIEELEANVAKFDGKIIGIDPGAGLMNKTKDILEEYNLNSFTLVDGSGANMTAALGEAIKNEQWIVVTGWTPHWKFLRWKLKYLKDPKGIYTSLQYPDKEHIATIVRHGLKEDKPEVYRLLDNFSWNASDMEQVMIWNKENEKNEEIGPYENAKRWIAANRKKVDEWKTTIINPSSE